MDPTWPDCPHPQCDARNPPEALYCARCGRPQYQSPGWQEHAIAKAKKLDSESDDGKYAVILIPAIFILIALVGLISVFSRS